MTTRWMLASTSAVLLTALGAAPSAGVTPMNVVNLTGTLRVQQAIPCGNHVDKSTPATAGRLTLTPSEGVEVPGGRIFSLATGSVIFAPFSMSGSCDGISRTTTFQELAVQLSRSVTFTATDAGGGLFNFVIPKDDLVVTENAIVDGAPDNTSKVPSEDVTGSIDLTNGKVLLHVVLATSIHFQGGCVPLLGCIVDETDSGTVTTDLTGTIVFPDSDADGVPDRVDNCPFVANADQAAVASPVVIAPPDVTLSSCRSRAFGIASANDVCGNGGTVSLTNNAPGVFPLGGSTVVWTAQDQQSRVGTASQIVTIVDTTAPTFTFVPGATTLNSCGPADIGLATAQDDCAGTPAVRNDVPTAGFGLGTTQVTWSATDRSGNTTTATQTVTVIDTVPPTVSCVADGPPGGTFRVTTADACGAPTIRLGDFVLGNGERIKINETGQSGVTLVNTVDGIRHFHVGKGQAIITATDVSGNVSTISCR